MEKRPYYKAYDDRYRQVHDQNLQWFSSEASPIVREIMDAFDRGKPSNTGNRMRRRT